MERLCCTNFNPDLTPDVRHTASVLSLAKALRWIPSSIICRVSDKDERKHEGTTPRSGGSTVMEPAWMTRLQADLINEDDDRFFKVYDEDCESITTIIGYASQDHKSIDILSNTDETLRGEPSPSMGIASPPVQISSPPSPVGTMIYQPLNNRSILQEEVEEVRSQGVANKDTRYGDESSSLEDVDLECPVNLLEDLNASLQAAIRTRSNTQTSTRSLSLSPLPDKGVPARHSFQTLDYRNYDSHSIFRDISRLVRSSVTTISGISMWTTKTPEPVSPPRTVKESKSYAASIATEDIGMENLQRQLVRQPSSIYPSFPPSYQPSVVSLICDTAVSPDEYAATLPSSASLPPSDSERFIPLKASFRWKDPSMRIRRGLAKDRIEAFESGFLAARNGNEMVNGITISSPLRQIANQLSPMSSTATLNSTKLSRVRQSIRRFEPHGPAANNRYEAPKFILQRRYTHKVRKQPSVAKMKVKRVVSNDSNVSSLVEPLSTPSSKSNKAIAKSKSLTFKRNLSKSITMLRQRISMTVIQRPITNGNSVNMEVRKFSIRFSPPPSIPTRLSSARGNSPRPSIIPEASTKHVSPRTSAPAITANEFLTGDWQTSRTSLASISTSAGNDDEEWKNVEEENEEIQTATLVSMPKDSRRVGGRFRGLRASATEYPVLNLESLAVQK